MNDSEKENIKLQYQSPSQSLTILKQASFISSTDPNLSLNHTFRCIKKRIPWSEEEDKAMKQLVNKYGTSNWTLISSKMGKARNGKQCRERWYNQLNPSMKKNNWTINEENILFSKHMQLGNKWADIASFLPGRTLTDIKNHFYSKLRKFIRKILKQINDEKLFQINGIDSCKYTGEKIYKMIKKHDITYKNLTKDTIFELIIATEKNPKGKFIFLSEQSGNEINEYNNNESTVDINNKNINIGNILPNNNFFIDESYENYLNDKSNIIKNNLNMMNINNQNNNITNSLNNNINNINNNCSSYNFDLTNSNMSNFNFKLKLRKYSNTNNTNEINSVSNNNNNIKIIQDNNKNNKIKKGRKSKQKNENANENEINDISQNKLVGKKRKKEKKIPSKKNDLPELILSNDNNNNINQKSKRKRKNSTNNKSNLNLNSDSTKKEDKEKDDKINNITNNNIINNNIYPPFNISLPKEIKNIYFPFQITKSNKSCDRDDFSFSNKYNISNDFIEPFSLQKAQMFPINYDNIYFHNHKRKNSIISDMSYDNNLSNINSKNDNTYRNFSINGNFYNKTLSQNNINNALSVNNLTINNNMSIKSFEEKTENKKDNEKPVIINIDVINNQDFANAFINGNTLEPNDKSQYNTSIYNKNNNNLNIFNPSSPPSVRSYWK